MEIPSLPTDNLYKFSAISGVMIFIFTLASFFWVDHTLSLKFMEATEELEKATAEAKYLDEQITEANRIYSLLTLQLERVKIDSSNKANKNIDVIAAVHEASLMHKELINNRKSKDDRKIELKFTNQRMIYFYKALIIGRVVGIVVILFSICLSYFSFRLWYYRLQKFQDKIIQRDSQIENKKKSL